MSRPGVWPEKGTLPDMGASDDKPRNVPSPEDLDVLLEHSVTMAANGLMRNAEAMGKIATTIDGLRVKVQGVAEAQREVRRLLLVVIATLIISVVTGGIAAYALVFFTVPNSRVLIDCTTPSTAKHKHPCSDRSGLEGFRLSTAIIRCEKGLPTQVHTADVQQCLAHELGISLAPSPVTP